MIIVQLKGGLGNQLFQYAAGFSLAMHHGVDIKVDISELKRPDDEIGTLRNFELQHIAFVPEIASQADLYEVCQQNVFKHYLHKLLPPFKRQIYKEAGFEFDDNFFKAGKHIYLKGYRQSEQYFSSIKEVIKQHFQLQPHLVTGVDFIAKKMKSESSVAIHFRRGDYANKALLDYHGVLEKNYYDEAMAYISERVNNPVYYIFSDNIEWVKQHFSFGTNVEFISGSISKNQYEDFYLMSQCRHNIIANSSYSWWAAYLNSYDHKMVVAPKKWFNNATINTKDLYPKEWSLI